MASTSSTLAAAITNVGIPLATPYPCSEIDNIHGTITAGVTADSTNLRNSMKCF